MPVPEPDYGYKFFSRNNFLDEKFIARKRTKQFSNSAESLIGSGFGVGAGAGFKVGDGVGARVWFFLKIFFKVKILLIEDVLNNFQIVQKP